MTTQVDQILTNPSSPFEKLQREYLQHMILKNCSARTLEYWAMNLKRFNRWCHDRGINEVAEVTPDILKSYRQYLFHYRNEHTGKKLKFSTQHCYLIVVRRWFKWLYENDHLGENVGQNLQIPKPEKRLPVEVLTADEVESIMNATNVQRPMGLRDRAILEVLYSTGIRNSELASLQLYDLDEDRQVVIVRHGKGNKDRIVPIGQRALKWTKKYIAEVRPSLVAQADPHSSIFVNANGRQIHRSLLSIIVRKCMKRAGITKSGSCHLLRHTAATLMMDNGCDIRSLQQFLGHERLTTTQIYLHVSINRLQDVHQRTHPANRSPTKSSEDINTEVTNADGTGSKEIGEKRPDARETEDDGDAKMV